MARFPEAAVILAGGRSRRLGQDKAAVVVEGQTMLARMIGLARGYCPLVAVCGRDPGQPAVQWFPDELPGKGPMGGIVTGLAKLRVSCLVLPCDLPFMDGPTLERLFQAWREKPAGAVITTFKQSWTGYIEALVAVYEPEAEPMLRQGLASGVSVLRAIPEASRQLVPYAQDQGRPFFNLNTPDNLAELLSAPGPNR